MSDFSGDYITASRKINQGKDWRGTATVSIGGETVEWGHRLLEGDTEFLRVKNVIPLSELQNHLDDEDNEDQKRLLELQQKGTDELTDEEEAELRELAQSVSSNTDQIEESLGKDAYDEFVWAGEQAMLPTEDDVRDIIDADPQIQAEFFGEIPDYLDEEKAERLLKEHMLETVDMSPYPIRFLIGQQAFMETVRVLGNGLNQEE